MARSRLYVEEEGDLDTLMAEKPVKARPAVPLIMPAAAPGTQQTTAQAPLTPPAPAPGSMDALANVAAGNQMDRNAPHNVLAASQSPNPMISGPTNDAAAIGRNIGTVNSINSGAMDYATAVRGGMSPQQATGMGLAAPYPQVTQPNLAYGGAPIGNPNIIQPSPRPGMQPGQRMDETPQMFQQRQADIATMNMENAGLGLRRETARNTRADLSRSARQLMNRGDTESAAALIAGGAGIATPARSTPASVAQRRTDDANKLEAIKSGGGDTKLAVSREATERERMRQDGLNTRLEKKAAVDAKVADYKTRSARLQAADKAKVDGLLTRLKNIGSARAKQEELATSSTKGEAALARIQTLDSNAEKILKDIESVFGQQPVGGGDGKTPQTAARPATPADAERLPSGAYFYDDKGVLRQRP